LKYEGKSRMPTQEQIADASAKADTPTGTASTQKAKPGRPRNGKNPSSVADKKTKTSYA
jgi:hypothetical protein